jgi:hypothetical protein
MFPLRLLEIIGFDILKNQKYRPRRYSKYNMNLNKKVLLNNSRTFSKSKINTLKCFNYQVPFEFIHKETLLHFLFLMDFQAYSLD